MSIIKKIARKFFSANKIVKLNITYCAPNETLKGHKVLVTGGSSGIGLAIAKRFLSEGAEVIICARKESNLTAVCQELNTPKLHKLVDRKSTRLNSSHRL